MATLEDGTKSWTLKTAGGHGKGTKEITAFMVSQQLYTKK